MEGFSFVTPVTGLTIDLILETKMIMMNIEGRNRKYFQGDNWQP
jgi:hypothetical protein